MCAAGFKLAFDELNLVVLEGRALQLFKASDLGATGTIGISELEVALMIHDVVPTTSHMTPLDSFNVFDLDGGGDISWVEFKVRRRKLGWRRHDCVRNCAKFPSLCIHPCRLHLEGNGEESVSIDFISNSSLVKGTGARSKSKRKRRVAVYTFRFLRCRLIECPCTFRQEAAEVIAGGKLTEEQAKELFDKVDADKSGVIEYGEFKQVWLGCSER